MKLLTKLPKLTIIIGRPLSGFVAKSIINGIAGYDKIKSSHKDSIINAEVAYIRSNQLDSIAESSLLPLLIKHPESLKSPKQQSKIGEYLALRVQQQIIIETYSEHLVNQIRYQVYSKKISSEDIVIYYHGDNEEPILIKINNSGHYIDLDGKKIRFPSGFFDATLKELLEIG